MGGDSKDGGGGVDREGRKGRGEKRDRGGGRIRELIGGMGRRDEKN